MGNASCTTSPLCYSTATTLQVDVYPNNSFASGCLGGNTIANGCTGATTAAGAFTNIVAPGGTLTGALYSGYTGMNYFSGTFNDPTIIGSTINLTSNGYGTFPSITLTCTGGVCPVPDGMKITDSAITFPDGSTQDTGGLPLSGGTITGSLTVTGNPTGAGTELAAQQIPLAPNSPATTGPFYFDNFAYPDGTAINGLTSPGGVNWNCTNSSANAVVYGNALQDNGTTSPTTWYCIWPANQADGNCQAGDMGGCVTTANIQYENALPTPSLFGPYNPAGGSVTFIAQGPGEDISAAVHINNSPTNTNVRLKVGSTFYGVTNETFPMERADSRSPYGERISLNIAAQSVTVYPPNGDTIYVQGSDSTQQACPGTYTIQYYGCYSSTLATYFGLGLAIHPTYLTVEDGVTAGAASALITYVSSGGKPVSNVAQGAGSTVGDVAALYGSGGSQIFSPPTFQIPAVTTGLGSITSGSGGTITGETSCPLSGFNNSLSGAGATVTFVTAGSWTNAEFQVTALGSGATAAPTSATLGSPCSGTATLVTTLGGGPGTYCVASSVAVAGYWIYSSNLTITASDSIGTQVLPVVVEMKNGAAPAELIQAPQGAWNTALITNVTASNDGGQFGSLCITTGSGLTTYPMNITVRGPGYLGFPPNLVSANPQGAPAGFQAILQGPVYNEYTASFTPATDSPSAPTVLFGSGGTGGPGYYTVQTAGTTDRLNGTYLAVISSHGNGSQYLEYSLDCTSAQCLVGSVRSSGLTIVTNIEASYGGSGANTAQIQYQTAGGYASSSYVVSATIYPQTAGSAGAVAASPAAMNSSWTPQASSNYVGPIGISITSNTSSTLFPLTGPFSGTVTYTAAHTANVTDNGKLIIMNCSAACALTLPTAQPSSIWTVGVLSKGSTLATITLGGSDTFNGGTAPTLSTSSILWVGANSAIATDYAGGN